MDNLEDIQKQIAELQKKAKDLVETRRQPIIEKMKQDIKSYGITASELGFKGTRGRKPSAPTNTQVEKKPVEPKYRLDEKTWSGRGKSPKWMVDFLSSGGDKKSLLIK